MFRKVSLSLTLAMLGSSAWIRIATADGQCWIYNGTVQGLSIDPKFMDRGVMEMYPSMGREAYNGCCDLCPAICIVVEGNENGTI